MIAEYAMRDSSIEFQYMFSFGDQDPNISEAEPGSYEDYVAKAEARHNEALWEDLGNYFGLDSDLVK
jgi:hypothetical protein